MSESSVMDILRKITNDQESIDRMEERINSKKMIKKLMAMRAALGFRQEDIGPEIVLLETQTDKELTPELVMKYTEAFFKIAKG